MELIIVEYFTGSSILGNTKQYKYSTLMCCKQFDVVTVSYNEGCFDASSSRNSGG